MSFSPAPKPRSLPKPRRPLKKSGRIKPKKRTAGEARRIYGPPKRREWMKDQACSACGVYGSSVSAHVLGNGGKSRKAGYRTTAPLCGRPMSFNWFGRVLIVKGCHQLFDEYRGIFDASHPHFNPETAAAQTEAAWQAFSKEGE